MPLSDYALSPSAANSAFVIDSTPYDPNALYVHNGTDYLALVGGASVTLASTANPFFSVKSIDLANYYYYDGRSEFNATATLTGTFADGTTISASYEFSNNNVLTTNDYVTELLGDFTNLTSFKIAASGYYLAIDNIVVTQVAAATTNVPEPASLAILGLGLVGIAAGRRRKSA